MGNVKRAVSLVVCVAILLGAAGCNGMPIETIEPTAVTALPVASAAPTESKDAYTPTLKPTEVDGTPNVGSKTPETPGPVPEYTDPDYMKAGLSNDQYEKIKILLYGLMGIGSDFANPKSLTREEYLRFFDRVIEGNEEILGVHDDLLFSIDEINQIVNSGLHVNYHAKNGDKLFDDQIKNGKLQHFVNGGDPRDVADIYSINKVSKDQLILRFYMILQSNGPCYYECNGTVVLQEDRNSIFGYHATSMQYLPEPSFPTVSASSSLKNTKSSFSPERCIDKDITTGWEINLPVGTWVELSSKEMQTVTGLSIYLGDRSVGDMVGDGGLETVVLLEFSDGTRYQECIGQATGVYMQDESWFIMFNREIHTKYVKITVVSSENDRIHFAEIQPF